MRSYISQYVKLFSNVRMLAACPGTNPEDYDRFSFGPHNSICPAWLNLLEACAPKLSWQETLPK
jgi:hypothetical protein